MLEQKKRSGGKKSNRSAGAGGAAAHSGSRFQDRVTAWVAVHILAEKDVSLPWDLPANVTLEYLQCNTVQAVDDLLVRTSEQGYIFAQVKHALNLETGAGSDLASALEQFVHQFLTYRSAAGRESGERKLDPEKDCFALITGPGSSAPIRKHLRSLLNRLRSLQPEQQIDCAALNQQEERALQVVKEHLTRIWEKIMGVNPTDDDLRQILSLVRVQVLEIDHGGSDELQAKNILRSSVLRNPDQSDNAWSKLLQACADFASERAGADRVLLQKILLQSGIDLKAPRSYQDDINRLQEYSFSTIEQMSELSIIRVGETKVKFHRRPTEALRSAVEEGSLIVTGEPGAGKSGILHDLAKLLQDEGRDFVFLAVDRFEAKSPGGLRLEIGLTRDISDVLMNWPGAKPAFLIIDDLDGARSGTSEKTFRELIAQVMKSGSRWRVIASMRKFDLRNNMEIRKIFRGKPVPGFIDEDFPEIRHINIPKLQEDELSQIDPQSPELANFLATAGEALREMLRVPFNLRLTGELLGEGMALEMFTHVCTQLELLDQYWWYRVIRNDGQGDTREIILRKAVHHMVKSRELRVNREFVIDSASSQALHDLLSSHVLTEWRPSPAADPDRYVLAFAHNVLFDYAVARLLLRGGSGKLEDLLVNDPELVLAIRPSLVFHFRHLWSKEDSRTFFWKQVLDLVQIKNVPVVGKLIGPGVAAEMANQLAEFEPLFHALEDPDPEIHEAAGEVLKHVTGSLLANLTDSGRPLSGEGAGPWCELLERTSRLFNIRPSLAYIGRTLLGAICEKPENLTAEQRGFAGMTARRLLLFAWHKEPRDTWLVNHALQAVCRTYESDPSASETLLRRSLEPAHMASYYFEEIPRLAMEIKRLFNIAPEFVADFYRTAFTFNGDDSDAKTYWGGGQIISLISNRRQDYQGALYTLAEEYPDFLRIAPLQAVSVLITVMEAYVAKHHPLESGEVIERSFEFCGVEARIKTDYSHIWDAGVTYRLDEPLKMLDAFENYLEQLSGDPLQTGKRKEILDLIARHNQLAVIWRRLLSCGTKYPASLGQEIRELAWSLPVLTCPDTSFQAGNFLSAAFGSFEPGDRERIELAILSLPCYYPPEERKLAEQERNRLLGCLPFEDLITDEAKQLLKELEMAKKIPPNEPPFKIDIGWGGEYGETDYLADEGVPVDEEQNRRMQELEQPIKKFAQKHLNSVPSEEEIILILPALKKLREALSTADEDGVHPRQRDYAWGVIAGGCERVTRYEGLSCQSKAGKFVKSVLLEAARHPDPAYSSESDASFNEFPSWGSPAARIDAAKGLTRLARFSNCVDQELLEAIKQLSQDEVPAVRYQVATGLLALYQTVPGLMWEIIEHFSYNEANRSVLHGLLVSVLGRLAGKYKDRVAHLTKSIFERVIEGPGSKPVREACISIFTGLYLWQDDPFCRDIVFAIADNPGDSVDEAHRIVADLGDFLTYGPVTPPEPEKEFVRRKAFDLMERILQSTRNSFEQIKKENSNLPFDYWPEDVQKQARGLAQLADYAGTRIYFTSGAYSEKHPGKSSNERILTPEEKRRFLAEADRILQILAGFNIPRVTHYLLETLESYIAVDPSGTFLRIGQVVRAGKAGGYQYESLAADLIVRLVERYLAEYRLVLRENEECMHVLLEILDIFVHAGWPGARRLVYRLEEIFR